MIKELSKHFKLTLILLAVSAFALFLVVIFPQEKPAGPSKPGLKTSVYIKFVPGITTEKDVTKVLGEPLSVKEENGKKYLTYKTESANFSNMVVFRNGVVYYSLENFFGNYDRRPGDYIKAYDKQELTLYDSTTETSEVYVFLKKGVAISVFPFENIIGKIIYFVPQTKKEFLTNIAPELGFVEEIEVKPEEISAPGY